MNTPLAAVLQHPSVEVGLDSGRQPPSVYRTTSTWPPHRWLGLALCAFGVFVGTGWGVQFEALSPLFPAATALSLLLSLMFLASGVCCLSLPPRGTGRTSAWAAYLGLAVLLVLPVVMMVVVLAQTLWSLPAGPHGQPHPVPISPDACVAFWLAGLGFLTARQRLVGRRDKIFIVTNLAVALIGLAGLAGDLLRLSPLYTLVSYSSMHFSTSLGLSVLAGNLWLLREHARSQDEVGADTLGQRISRRSLALLTLVVVGAGVAGFSVLRGTFDESASDNLFIHATTHAAALTNTVDVGLWVPRALALRPEVQRAVAQARTRGGADAPVSLQPVVDAALASGVIAVRIVNEQGKTVATHGSLSDATALSVQPVRAPQGVSAWLMWDGGYVLQVRSDVMYRARRVGSLITEQRLPLADKLLADLRASGASTDAVLCSRDHHEAVCTPTRFNPQPFRVPLFDASGYVQSPIGRALLGQSGVRIGNGRNEAAEMSAFVPLAGLGLGLVVRVDMHTLYAPLRERLKLLVMALVILIAFGTLVLRSQVRPLVKRLVSEQRRTQVILDHANDAFVALGAQGEVTDWNAQAERTFGWRASEAMGRRLSEIILPPGSQALRALDIERAPRAHLSAADPAFNGRIEAMVLHQKGHQFPVEISLAFVPEGPGHVLTAFFRDITERRLAQQKLADSEKRLRSVTDNLPGLMSYIDHGHMLTFCNATFQAWMGIDPATAIGRPLDVVIGPTLYAQQLPHLQRALAGERAEFEMRSDALNVCRYLKNVYIPDVDESGHVAGVYALSTDVTAMKLVEMHLNELARVDSLTGLPNRRQFEERLQDALARSRRSRQPMALMFLDVDHFKDINDTHGHAAGDAVLKEFANRLRECLRATDTVARLAGDEFVVILEGLHANEEASMAAKKIGAALRTPINTGEVALSVTSSIGVAFFNGGDTLPEAIIAKADEALYMAKRAGRNTFAVSTF